MKPTAFTETLARAWAGDEKDWGVRLNISEENSGTATSRHDVRTTVRQAQALVLIITDSETGQAWANSSKAVMTAAAVPG